MERIGFKDSIIKYVEVYNTFKRAYISIHIKALKEFAKEFDNKI